MRRLKLLKSLLIALLLVIPPHTNITSASSNLELNFEDTTVNTTTGSSFSVPVFLKSTASQVRAVDIVIDFDTTKVNVTDFSNSVSGSNLRFVFPTDSNGNPTKSTLMSNANSTGKIRFSYATYNRTNGTVLSPITFNSRLAMITFTAISTGSTTLTFSYLANQSSLDTNIVSSQNPPTDLIASQSDLISAIINISTPITPTPTLTPTSTLTPTITPTTTTIPSPTQSQQTKRKRFGDLNNNGVVDISDISILATYWNSRIDTADVNCDTYVNLTDLSIIAVNWGKSSD